jgi:hypothetical protein
LRAPFGVRLDDLTIRPGVADFRQIENMAHLSIMMYFRLCLLGACRR